jgi:L-ascorbate metabolism protein UlaG (beta-lactamase superfamily)
MLRGALRLAVSTVALAAGGWVLRALHGAPAALGAAPSAIRAAAERSPNCRDGIFVNADPASMFSLNREQRRLLMRGLVGRRTAVQPAPPIPLAAPHLPELDESGDSQAAGLAVTWLGHATALIEIDGFRVLTDPMFSERCSPSDVLGPRRLHPPPVRLDTLPAIDAVVISHDHYDHLDIDTVIALARSQRAPFVVPLGVGAHLRAWGIPDDRIVELDWQESTRIDELTVTCTPARHFSGRFVNRNLTLWASWVLGGPVHRAYFAGDTGYTWSFGEIGSDYGPFDLTLMPIGAYNAAWPDIHMTPEEAVQAHRDVVGSTSGLLVPIHWATFRLAPHPWAEPIERLVAAAETAGVPVAVPKPGERVDAKARHAESGPWWRL